MNAKELTYTEFYMRENSIVHSPVKTEMNFYDCIKRGDIDGVNSTFTPLGSKGYGVLSDDALRNLKYHLIITIAFMTRFCVEGGMERETAYNLSDIYIRQADKAKTAEDIHCLHKNAVMDYTDRMSRIKRNKVYSKPVVDCFEYVYEHLNEKIRVIDIAGELNLSVPYLSNLFHKETGITINRYINKKRIETASRMLIYSDYEAADIANFLAYSSHSRFIEVFKRETGLTPRDYRKKYYNTGDGLNANAGKRGTDIQNV